MLSYRLLSTRGCARSFGSTTSRGDFMSWFKRNKDSEKNKQTKDTKEVINEIESGKDLQVQNLKVTKLELNDENFVGVDFSKAEKQKRMESLKNVSFNRWLADDKVETPEQLEQVVFEAYQEAYGVVPGEEELSAKFVDLVGKFKFTKILQSKAGYMIPDYQLTRLETPDQFKRWFANEVLSGKLGKFNPAEPNAIDLSNIKFPPNVYVVPDVKAAEKKQKIQTIISEVTALEQELERAAIERAKNE